MDSPQQSAGGFERAIDLLLTRRSAKTFLTPGPTPNEVETILKAAARAPDHGKLFPWRFILFEGEARPRFGAMLVEVLRRAETVSPEREARERARFERAPLVVGVVSRVRTDLPIPEWEQVLSAGAVCQNMLLAAQALGYAGNWLTEWYAYHPDVAAALGLSAGERIAGFVHIGRAQDGRPDRPRPDLSAIVTRY